MYSASLIDFDSQARLLANEMTRSEERLAYTRQLQSKILAEYCSEKGISELEAYCRAAQSPTYRSLRRDEQFYQSLWFRAQARLLQISRSGHSPKASLSEKKEILKPEIANYSIPVRQVIGSAPGRNEPCRCGSGIKYKRCCGNPLSSGPAARDPLRIVPPLPQPTPSPPRAMG